MPSSGNRKPLRLFLSYAREDSREVDEFYRALAQADEQPWLDRIDLEPGDLAVEEIANAIASCDWFLIFLSQNSVQEPGALTSHWVRQELAAAMRRQLDERKRTFVIPLVLDNLPEQDLPQFLPDLVVIRVQDLGLEEAVQRVLKTIRGKPRPGANQETREVTQGAPGDNKALSRLLTEFARPDAMIQVLQEPGMRIENVAQPIADAVNAAGCVVLECRAREKWLVRSVFGPRWLNRDARGTLEQYAKLALLLEGEPSYLPQADSPALFVPIKRHGLLSGAIGVFDVPAPSPPKIGTEAMKPLKTAADVLAERFFQRKKWRDSIELTKSAEHEDEAQRIINRQDFDLDFWPVFSLWAERFCGWQVRAVGPEHSSLHDSDALFQRAQTINRSDELALAILEALPSRQEKLTGGMFVSIEIPPALLKPESPLRNGLAGNAMWLWPWQLVVEIDGAGEDMRSLRAAAADLIRDGFALVAVVRNLSAIRPADLEDLAPHWIRISAPKSAEQWKELTGLLTAIERHKPWIVADSLHSEQDIPQLWRIGVGFLQGEAICGALKEPDPTRTPSTKLLKLVHSLRQ